MKVLVISDSHGRCGKIKKMMRENLDADCVIFLGDGENDFELALVEIKEEFLKVPEIYQVCGNCDRDSREEVTIVVTIDEKRFYVTHGFAQGVKYDLRRLAQFAKDKNCEVALFGHTHGAYCSELDGVKLFNPGCAMNGGYGVICVEDGVVSFENRVLD